MRISRQRAFTLVELLIVVMLISVLAGMVLTRMEPNVVDRLTAAADVLASDLHYARELAIANNSSYEIRFDVNNNSYVLRHTGTNSALNNLPRHPFLQDSKDALGRPIQRGSLSELASVGEPPKLWRVQGQVTSQQVTAVEFGPTGQTTAGEDVIIWLVCGVGHATRYIPVTVTTTTGMVTVGNVTSSWTTASPNGEAVSSEPLGESTNL